MLADLQLWIDHLGLPIMLIVGGMTLLAFYVGRSMKFLRLPSIMGFMVTGVILGPSIFGLIHDGMQVQLSFVTDIALAFVALSIGMELNLRALKRQGTGMVIVILTESLLAFVVVTTGVWLLTHDLPLALLFGAIAPASAPAGTVAVIQEYKARGSLTRALYAVVGFDDGLGIIIFGFASALARSLVDTTGQASVTHLVLEPLGEVLLSLVVGGVIAVVFLFLIRRPGDTRNLLVHVFAIVMVVTGLCHLWGLSIILTHMIIGLVMVNTQPANVLERVRNQLTEFMPLLFILFFTLAGASLHLAALPSLGALGIVYVLCRSAGLMGGAYLGATWGKLEDKIRKYLGMGILSQAGVAIGLALVVKSQFSELGERGVAIGATVLTTVTATCIFFELIGPILTKIALDKAGETNSS